jgi:ABC-2 type transport system ATP-binding protein/sodium transport system ATP-binding protein
MIRAVELTKRFRLDDGQVLLAVDRLSLHVAPGEVYGLLGPNGAGKTTTMRMVLGLLEPDSGFVSVGGVETSQNPDEVKRRIGFVAANDGVYPWSTVRETLAFFADLYDVDPTIAEQRIESLAELLEFTGYLDRRAGGLSTGQRQRVTLARGLIHDPPVIMLDEPTRGLDVIGCKTVYDYVAHLRRLGKSVVICTHGLDEAERLCDRFGLLHRGQMRYEGTLSELQQMTHRVHLVDMFLDLLHGETPAVATP